MRVDCSQLMAVTGVVTVNGTLDYETATSHNIIVRASSSDGSSNTQLFTINVTNVNESGVTAISDTDAAADSVLENVSVGTVVGLTAFADDLDATDTVSYSLDDDAGGLFAIDVDTGCRNGCRCDRPGNSGQLQHHRAGDFDR